MHGHNMPFALRQIHHLKSKCEICVLTLAATSAVSRKFAQLPTPDLARNSSMSRTPIL
jgi:hypothetical protein